MTSRISFNVHANNLADPQRTLAHIQRLKPTWLLVMDNLDFARQAKQRSPVTNVIFRAWPDDGLHTWISADDWARQTKARIGDADMWVYAGNEPGWSAYLVRQMADAMRAQRVRATAARAEAQTADGWLARLKALVLSLFLWFFTGLSLRFEASATKSSVRWAIEVVHACKKYGLKVVVLNLSSGTPNPDDWKTALALDLLRLLDANRQMAVLGLHEYCCVVVTSGFVGGWPQFILPDSWPPDVRDITCWHLGRYKFVISACEAAGIRPPRIVVTEFGFDDMSDVKAWADMLPNTPGYSSLRGWKSLVEAWKQMYGALGWSAEDTIYNKVDYAERVIYFHEAVEAVLWFSEGASSSLWDQFNAELLFKLKTKLEERTSTMPNAPPVELTPGRYRVQFRKPDGSPNSTREINFRLTANGALADGVKVKHGTVLDLLADAPVLAGGYWWRRAIVSGLTGFFALVSDIHLAPDAEVPPAPPDGDYKPILQGLIQAVINSHHFLAQEHERMVTYHTAQAQLHLDEIETLLKIGNLLGKEE